jgi:hypothetical protein
MSLKPTLDTKLHLKAIEERIDTKRDELRHEMIRTREGLDAVLHIEEGNPRSGGMLDEVWLSERFAKLFALRTEIKAMEFTRDLIFGYDMGNGERS